MPKSTSQDWLTPLAYLAVYIGWGTTYLAIRVGVQTVGPATFLGLRFLIAATAILPLLILLPRTRTALKSLDRNQVLHSAWQGALMLIGGLLPVAYAEKTIPSHVAAIIIGCAPILFALFDRALNGTRIRSSVFVGFAFGFAGVTLLALSGKSQSSGQDSGMSISLYSISMVVLAVAFWSFGSVYSRRLKIVNSPLIHIFVQYLAASILYFLIAVVSESVDIKTIWAAPSSFWQSLLYIALVPSLVSYTAFMRLLKTEPSNRIATYAFVNPVVAVIAGALILNEQVSLVVISALALVMTGTWFNFRKPRQ